MKFSKETWKRIQEIVGIVSGVGTLILAVVTLWLTTQISGVENYLRSEIGYRNEQLITAAENLRELAQQKVVLERQTVRAHTQLTSIQKEVEDAQIALVQTRQQNGKIKGELDTRLRAQAFATLERAGYLRAIFLVFDNKDRVELGKHYLDSISKIKADPSLSHLLPYIKTFEIRGIKKCRGLEGTAFELPTLPELGTEAWLKIQKVRSDLLEKGISNFYQKVSECACDSLASGKAEKEEICKSQELP